MKVMRQKIHIYLVSDSTGETVANIAKSTLALFDDIKFEKHLRPMFRQPSQLDELKLELQGRPGVVMSTIIDEEMNNALGDVCGGLNILYVPVLERVIKDLSAYLNVPMMNFPGRQHELNDSYFAKIDALNFSLSHDDGLGVGSLGEADVILVGVSRSSKSPTSIYLAYRGIKCANVPFVMGQGLPKELVSIQGPLVVGLTVNSERLVDIRKNRLLTLGEDQSYDYVKLEEVTRETEEAKKVFRQMGWPVIDVTRRSIEETASLVISLLDKSNKK
jgi:regulator of PEP synthase PpsR (kinase-PPPase family)